MEVGSNRVAVDVEAGEERTTESPTLDGVWDVARLSGALPSLRGCVKRISGRRGRTEFPHLPRMPFEVRELELHYRGPFSPLVDKLEPEGDGFVGRATLFGREVGRFRLRRVETGPALRDQLVRQLHEAHELEKKAVRMLDRMIATADDPQLLDTLEYHKAQTQSHLDLVEERLAAHGETPPTAGQVGGLIQELAKPVDRIMGATAAPDAKEAFATEHLEIATYELLRTLAAKAGDLETAQTATEILEEERRMTELLSEHWETFAERSLRDEGVRV